MKYCSFHSKKLGYHIQGSGPCLVLLHGFPMDSRIWEMFAEALQDKFTVICIDLPGFGQSDSQAEKHDMELMAAAVTTVLHHENIDKCVLAGHSMGGYAGLEFASQFPESLSGLVLFHSQAGSDDEQAKQARNETIMRVKQDKTAFVNGFISSLFDPAYARLNPKTVEHYRQLSLEQKEEGIVAALAGLRDRKSHISTLTQIKTPVLFILGKSDGRLPVLKIMAQAGLPAHAELLILDNTGHMGFAEKPKQTREVLRDFALRCF